MWEDHVSILYSRDVKDHKFVHVCHPIGITTVFSCRFQFLHLTLKNGGGGNILEKQNPYPSGPFPSGCCR